MAGQKMLVKLLFYLVIKFTVRQSGTKSIRTLIILPVISYNDLNNLPDISAVYVVFANDIILYVGSTVRLRTRFRDHHKKEFFKGKDVYIEYMPCEVHQLGPLENQKIRELSPTLNSYSNRRKIKPNISASTALLGKPYNPFGQINNETSLRDKTIYLLNSQREKSLRQIAKELEVNYEWICLFSRGKSINPGVNTVQKLYEYLTKSRLAV